MAITLPSGFKITAQEAVDNRLLLSKAEMVAIVDAKMPEKYLAVCKDDGALYLYNVNNTALSTTGKFRKFEGGAPDAYLKSASVSNNSLTLTKQDDSTVVFTPQTGATYTAGTNIQISDENVISATDTTYSAGAGITIDNNVIAIDGNSGIAIYDNRIADANQWLTNGYTKTRNESEEYPTATANLPSVCTGSDRWGVLLYVAENNENKAGLQQYFPIDGTYKGRLFYRSVTGWGAGIDPEFGEWELVPWSSEKQDTLTAGTSIQISDNVISASVTKDQVGLGNVDNTSDLNKPISTATQTALDAKSTVAVAASGSATNEVQYIIVDGTEYKLAGGGAAYTAGTNISIENNVISAIDTKIATSITLGKEITASQTVGGIAEGIVYSADTTLATIIEDLLGGETPTGDGKLYYGVSDTIPTSVSGMTEATVEKETLISNGYTWKNITANNQYVSLAIDTSLGLDCYEILQNGFALGFNVTTIGSQKLYTLTDKVTDTGMRLVYHFEEA